MEYLYFSFGLRQSPGSLHITTADVHCADHLVERRLTDSYSGEPRLVPRLQIWSILRKSRYRPVTRDLT